MPVCLFALLMYGTACNSNQSTENSADSITAATDQMSTDTSSTVSDQPDTSKSADREFAMEAASGGLMEVAAGKLAATNASSAKVKEFGRMMVTDHTKANAELKAVAAKKNITIPTAPIEKHQEHIDMLKTKKGADFDKEYIDMMVDDHEEDVSKFETEANKGNDADVKAFASKTLPVLNKHLQAVKTIKEGMKQ